MIALKKKDADDQMTSEGGCVGEVVNHFHGYDLEALEIPNSARPRTGSNHLGKHGYTLRSRTGAVSWFHPF